MKTNDHKAKILVVSIALLGAACEMSQGYKKAPQATNATITGSLKMGQVEEQVGGCGRGLFVVDALKDYTAGETGGFSIHSAGFVAEKADGAKGKAHMALSLLTNENAKALVAPKGYEAPALLDMGGSVPISIGGPLEASSPSFAEEEHSAAAGQLRKMAIAGQEAAPEESQLTKNAKGAYMTTSAGVTVKNVTLGQIQRMSSAQTSGVGPVGSIALGSSSNGIGAGTFAMPSDVGEPKISATTAGIDVSLARAQSKPGEVSYLEIEVRNYPPTNSAKDWRAVFRAPEPEGSDPVVTLKVPGDGKLKEGQAMIDVTRAVMHSAKAGDQQGGDICVTTRVTARGLTNIGAPAAPAAN